MVCFITNCLLLVVAPNRDLRIEDLADAPTPAPVLSMRKTSPFVTTTVGNEGNVVGDSAAARGCI